MEDLQINLHQVVQETLQAQVQVKEIMVELVRGHQLMVLAVEVELVLLVMMVLLQLEVEQVELVQLLQ